MVWCFLKIRKKGGKFKAANQLYMKKPIFELISYEVCQILANWVLNQDKISSPELSDQAHISMAKCLHCNCLTLTRTRKFMDGTPALPGVFDTLQYFETILSLVESLWSS